MFASYWGRHSRSRCKTPLGSCEYCLTNIARACNVFYHRCVKCALSYISRAEEVMTECDIHHTRSIKTNSGVNLSRKPGLDLCCDLLQHLQRVPCTCSFWVFTSCTYIDFVRLITQILFHVKCYHIIFSYYMDGSFRSILLCFTVKQQYHAYLTPPSMRVI